MARILIVDDEPVVRNLIRATLDFGEHELLEANDGAGALTLGEAVRPDLVILDLGLPGKLTGLEVLKRLKASTGKVSQFVVLTGSGADQEEAARAAGANDFLTKPFSPLQLIECIERALSNGVS